MSVGSSAGGSGGDLHLAFGTPIGDSASLLGGGGCSDRGGGVCISSDIRRSANSGSVATSSIDTGDI